MQRESHPLESFFHQAVRNSYEGKLGLNDPDVTGYVARLLCEFSRVDKLYKVRESFVIPVYETGSCDNPAFVQYNLPEGRYLFDQTPLAAGKDIRWFVESKDPKFKESFYTSENLRAISER